MENSKNYIENLYSNTFGNYEDTPTNDEWTTLSKKLGRVNFLKFSFTTFNVFYLFVILALTGSTAYFGMNNYILLSKNKLLEMQIEKLKHSIIRSNVSAKTKQSNLPNADNYVENASTVSLKKVKKSVANTNISKYVETNNNCSKNPSTQKSVINSTNISEFEVIENEVAKPNETKTNSEAAKADSSTINKDTSPKIKKVKKTVFIKQSHVVVKGSIINNKVK